MLLLSDAGVNRWWGEKLISCQLSPSRYSTNEGETWKTFTFSEKPVFVYGLLTEPGEKSTIFTIFGSYKENGHSWIILQINTTDVLGKCRRAGMPYSCLLVL